jgi:hypothetical protein
MKKHDFSRVSVHMGEKEIPVTNHINIRYSLGYTAKHDGEGVSTDHFHKFDLQMSILRMVELCKNSITIKWVNDRVRPLSSAKANKTYPRGHVVKYDDVFPGKTVKIVKQMTDAEVLEMAKNDKDYARKLMEKLQAQMADGENV